MESNSYYNKYYNTIINNIINNIENNKNIILFIKNQFVIDNNIEFIINKKILIINDNNESNKDFNNQLFNKNSINILNNINEIDIIKKNNEIFFFDIVVIFTIESLQELKNIFYITNNFNNINTKYYMYISLSNENNQKIKYKNLIINTIKKYSKYKIGNVINYQAFLKFIEDYNKYKINSLKIYKNSNYILYGNNFVYETILGL